MNKNIKLSNPGKFLWPHLGITKLDYARIMHQLSPYLLNYTKDRYLTCIRYPDGIDGKSFYQKNSPPHAPDWIPTEEYGDIHYINLKEDDILLWLCNLAVIEFHVSFNSIHGNIPDFIVFDLDPSEGVSFELVREGAMKIHETLRDMSITCIAKTSGATGIQILIPHGKKLDYEQGRQINEFFAAYFAQKYPGIFTIERMVKNRGKKIYFDYLQMWQGKSIIAAYSPRAVKEAAISMPLTWNELSRGVVTRDFHLKNILSIMEERGDLLADYVHQQNLPLHNIFKEIKNLQH
ncbi:MAG: non-homologous end-joining DNA ligase [Eubacteriales bacterium]